MKRTSNKRLTKNRLRGFLRRDDGATAIEFAILAMPFFMLLFGIIEISIIFFTGSNVKNATLEASRRIRTGEFNTTYAASTDLEADFKNLLCREMTAAGNTTALNTCLGRLSVKVKTLSDFSSATAFAVPPVIDPLAPPPPNFEISSGGDTVIVTSTYKYPLTIPSEISRLSNIDGENSRNITSVTAFRNEPF